MAIGKLSPPAPQYEVISLKDNSPAEGHHLNGLSLATTSKIATPELTTSHILDQRCLHNKETFREYDNTPSRNALSRLLADKYARHQENKTTPIDNIHHGELSQPQPEEPSEDILEIDTDFGDIYDVQETNEPDMPLTPQILAISRVKPPREVYYSPTHPITSMPIPTSIHFKAEDVSVEITADELANGYTTQKDSDGRTIFIGIMDDEQRIEGAEYQYDKDGNPFTVYYGKYHQGEREFGILLEHENPIYIGEFGNGRPHGKGTTLVPFTDSIIVKEGIFSNGTWTGNGLGNEYDKDGKLIYSGPWVNGKKDGDGAIETDAQGRIIFDGKYRENHRSQGIEYGYYSENKRFGCVEFGDSLRPKRAAYGTYRDMKYVSYRGTYDEGLRKDGRGVRTFNNPHEIGEMEFNLLIYKLEDGGLEPNSRVCLSNFRIVHIYEDKKTPITSSHPKLIYAHQRKMIAYNPYSQTNEYSQAYGMVSIPVNPCGNLQPTRALLHRDGKVRNGEPVQLPHIEELTPELAKGIINALRQYTSFDPSSINS